MDALDSVLTEIESSQGRTARFDAEMAFRDSEYSKRLDQTVFSRPPTKSRLDELEYFLVMGIDAKITPEGKVKIIELNGINSGVKGMTILERRSNGAEDPAGEWIIDKFQSNCSAALIQENIDSYGLYHMAYISHLLSLKGIKSYRLRGVSALHDVNVSGEWRRYDRVAETCEFFYKSFYDKKFIDGCFSDCRKYKPKTFEFDRSRMNDLLVSSSSGLVILKPINGRRGQGIMVSDGQTEIPENYLMEEFIESKPIKSAVTGEHHDGCMRCLFLVEKYKNGEFEVRFCGGYWRLAPLPISLYGELDSMRASMSQGAIPEVLNQEDAKLVASTVKRIIPSVCERISKEVGTPIMQAMPVE